MKSLLAFINFTLLMLSGCTPDTVFQNSNYAVSVEGNLYSTFSSESSRHNTTDKQLPEYSQISLFSSGGLQIKDCILTYTDSKWQGEFPKQWGTKETPANILAYYPPVLEDKQPLYNEDNELQDILICQHSIPYGNPIQLNFTHLFAQITFSVSTELNQELEQIEFTPSISISYLDPETSQITYSNQSQHTICLKKKENSTYSLLVPPNITMSINITLVTKDKRIQTSLVNHSFESGNSYDCLIKTTEGNIGIYTPEDFIAFTHLINGKEYGTRDLKEFGETVNGVTTYYLQNDLTFNEAQCNDLLDIGYIQTAGHEAGFSDIFDGQHHTLNNIILKTFTYRLRTGLFGLINETGMVKNLQLSQITYSSENNKCSMIGFLCGENRGIIDGCRVINSLLKTDRSNNAGGIVGINIGSILNCSVTTSEFSYPKTSYGGISYINMKEILNCFTENCTYKKATSGAGITYEQREGGTIENCFTHNNIYPSKYGALIYKGNGGSITHSYYPKSLNAFKSNKTTVANIFSYNSQSYITTDRNQSLLDLLNLWTENEGTSQYPNYSFWKWTQGENSLIIHVRP